MNETLHMERYDCICSSICQIIWVLVCSRYFFTDQRIVSLNYVCFPFVSNLREHTEFVMLDCKQKLWHNWNLNKSVYASGPKCSVEFIVGL
jgi:hypothetical protein